MSFLVLILAITGVPYRIEAGQMDIVLRAGSRVMQMSGGVRIITEDATIFSRKGEYIEEQDFALLLDSVRMQGKDFTVRSDTLKYWAEPERMIFSGRVRAEDETRSLETRVLESIGDRGSLSGDVKILYREEDAQFSGAQGTYDLGTEEAWLFGAPEAIIAREETLRVQADTFHFHGDTVFGGPDVGFTVEEREGGGSSFAFMEDRGTLSGDAWMSWDGGIARSDTLRFEIQEGRMREVTFSGHVRLENETEDGALSLEAPWMRAWVLEGRLESLEVKDVERGVYANREGEGEE